MRILPPALKIYFDSKIPDAAERSPTELLCEVAVACVGVSEVGGDNRGPVVELFQATVAKPVMQPWCLDFIQACIAYVEDTKRIKSALSATQLCAELWETAPQAAKLEKPERGDIILWRKGDTRTGHCGLVLGQDSLRYQTVEGNTSDSFGIDRNGDGVYSKNRAKGGSKTFVEVGFLRVF